MPNHRDRIFRQVRASEKRDWQLIPIPHGQKAPVLKNWPQLRLTVSELEEALGPSDGIGVILGNASNGLVDIDVDAQEALAAAREFLPPTARRHGRPSKPNSHFFYEVQPPPSPTKFCDLDGSTLIEVRSNGQQTLIPPTFHPGGERFRWEGKGDAARVEGDLLFHAVSLVGAISLLARHWPNKGSRHEASKALAGLLLRSGWLAERAEQFVTAVARASMRDEEWATRKSDIRTTVRRLAEGLPVTGVPRLTEFIGDAVVARAKEWLGLPPQITVLDKFSGSVDLPKWPEKPTDQAFHGLVGDIVRTIDPSTEADPVALLVQLLLAFGSIIGRKPHFLVEASRHTTNLFAALVGATSKGRKGVSWSQILRLLREVDPEWVKNCVQSGLSTGQGLIASVRDPVVHPQLAAGSIDEFDYGVVDEGVADKRLFVFESEFVQPLKLMSQPGNILSNTIRQSWDTGNLQTLTKTNPVRASDAHISILGHITQQELTRYLTETEQANGFGNRFLWVCVKRSKFLPDGGRLKTTELSRLSRQLQMSVEFARSVEQLKRGKIARELWHAVYPELSEGKTGLFGALTGRAEAQVTRLALVYALMDRSHIVRREHLEAALALWQYVESSIRFIFGDSLGDTSADEILKALRVSPQGLTRTEISNLFSRHRNARDIGRGLSVLAQNGLASFRREETNGRPDERWFTLGPDAKDAKNK
jgi:hypothetical protein